MSCPAIFRFRPAASRQAYQRRAEWHLPQRRNAASRATEPQPKTFDELRPIRGEAGSTLQPDPLTNHCHAKNRLTELAVHQSGVVSQIDLLMGLWSSFMNPRLKRQYKRDHSLLVLYEQCLDLQRVVVEM